ncbi:hypothetical protein [Aeropyrum pernix]|uniref:hypothetical protein n=1 Tax=Aeropyrum pernix TaxID=56636 RepID=UPI0018D3BE87|nr:hypothetical protein [Aeropyrum pernix]
MSGWRGVSVVYDRCVELGKEIGRLVESMDVDQFLNPEYYPPADAPREVVASYFLVMVAMDHRLSRPGKPYEAVVDGKLYHGADLLYRLGSKKLQEDPGFFTAERLSRVTVEDVKEWLSVGNASPPDPDVRAKLLRDLGRKLMALYQGSAWMLIVESKGYLRRGVGEGFVDRLKVFTAYQDPVEKKAFLLAKFLERRGVARFADPHNKELPVDNHLVRLALRMGIVSATEDLLEAVKRQREVDTLDDVALRLASRRAWRIVAQHGGIDPFILDDFLWAFGRLCCTRDAPTCRTGCSAKCRGMGWCDGGCPLSRVCRAYSDDRLMVPEHRFLLTWWY